MQPMGRFARFFTALMVTGLLMAASSTAASAVYSYQGSDYSYNYSSSYMRTCDQESDSTKVKSKADSDNFGGGSDAAKDTDGNNGICATKNVGWSIFRHKTCEYRSWWPDTCGNWQAA